MNKAPAFQFYPNDWLSSPNIMLMTPAQEGAYIRLLAIAWSNEDCGLPDDDNSLALLSRLGEGWFNGGSTVVKKCFICKDGRLYNERLMKERTKQEEWRKKSSAGGKKSAKQREAQRLTRVKGGCQMVATTEQPKVNSSSSSSSSSSDPNPPLPPTGELELGIVPDEWTQIKNVIPAGSSKLRGPQKARAKVNGNTELMKRIGK